MGTKEKRPERGVVPEAMAEREGFGVKGPNPSIYAGFRAATSELFPQMFPRSVANRKPLHIQPSVIRQLRILWQSRPNGRFQLPNRCVHFPRLPDDRQMMVGVEMRTMIRVVKYVFTASVDDRLT